MKYGGPDENRVERDPGVSSVQEIPYSYFIYGDPDENRVERDPGVSSVQETPIIILFMVAPTRIELVSSV